MCPQDLKQLEPCKWNTGSSTGALQEVPHNNTSYGPWKTAWKDGIMTEGPRLSYKYNVPYVIDGNLGEIYWVPQEKLLFKNLWLLVKMA